MPVSVALEFALPAQPDIVKLLVYESATKDGVFTVIEETTEVGSYPNYISNFTTDQAVNENDWFAIAWVDSKGAKSELSIPWKGGTQSVVSLITQRVMQRGISANEAVVIQEAEGVAEEYFGKDPYLVELPISYRVLSGLTYLTLARSFMVKTVASETSGIASWTAGLVSMKSGDTTTNKVSLDWLTKEAARLLGLSYSRVAQMIVPETAGGLSTITNLDISRLRVTSLE